MTLMSETVGDVSVVETPGKALDASIAPDFKGAAGVFVRPDAKVVFDMSNTEFVDSSGLGAIVSILKRMHEVKGDLKLCGLKKPVRALFELVRMHRVFEIFNTREEAIKSFSV